MDLSTRKYIKNSNLNITDVLPKFNLGDEVRKTGSLSTPYNSSNTLTKYQNSLQKSSPSSSVGSSVTKPSGSVPPGVDLEGDNGMSAQNIVGGAVGALNAGIQILNSSKPTVTQQELEASAKKRTENVAGIQTEQYGPIDEQQASVDVAGSAMSGLATGAAAGAAFGPWGAAIGGVLGGLGGLFGGASKKREHERLLEQARRNKANENIAKHELSYSQSLQKQEAEEHGDLYQSLFGNRWATGKEPDINPETGYSKKNYSVNTAYGKQIMPQNAWVSKGEVIESPDGNMYKVGFGGFAKGKKDTERAFIQDGDTIYSDAMINPDTGHTFAEDAPIYREMNMLPKLRMNQKMVREGVYGKRPLGKFAFGYENLIPTVAGLLGSYSQYKEASQPLYAPDVRTENAYAGVIPQMFNQRLDYYPALQQNKETEAAARAATSASGGLSAGQKTLAFANLYNNTQKNNSKIIFDTQLTNHQLRQKAYETALQVGAQDAARRQQGNIFNAEYLSKAHNAALQGRQMAMYNGINALQNYFANQFKINQFNKTLAMYYRDMEERRKDRK